MYIKLYKYNYIYIYIYIFFFLLFFLHFLKILFYYFFKKIHNINDSANVLFAITEDSERIVRKARSRRLCSVIAVYICT